MWTRGDRWMVAKKNKYFRSGDELWGSRMSRILSYFDIVEENEESNDLLFHLFERDGRSDTKEKQIILKMWWNLEDSFVHESFFFCLDVVERNEEWNDFFSRVRTRGLRWNGTKRTQIILKMWWNLGKKTPWIISESRTRVLNLQVRNALTNVFTC